MNMTDFYKNVEFTRLMIITAICSCKLERSDTMATS